jgi:alkyl hydroperoxide reductase subunit AhpF
MSGRKQVTLVEGSSFCVASLSAAYDARTGTRTVLIVERLSDVGAGVLEQITVRNYSQPAACRVHCFP